MEVKTTSLLALVLGIIGIIFLPLGIIWAINTLFATNIEYSLTNWAAAIFLQFYLQIIIKSAVLGVKSK
tara:strand:+ start:407 stop:613 length:207 start_codon:yes stop_codon:yes gene_type:complete